MVVLYKDFKILFIIILFLLWEPIYSQTLSFRDEAIPRGLTFIHDNGGTDQKYYVETMGSGCCLIDYDGDKDLDIFFLQGAPLPGWEKDVILRNQLFRNDGGQFVNVTGESGLGDTSYGIGCSVADYDNDGDADLYITNFGEDILYRNEGNGTFADVSYVAGISNSSWGSTAVFFDADHDGWLDIFVVNYIDYSIKDNPWCGEKHIKRRTYCSPDMFSGTKDQIYHNNGDGTFSDMSKTTNIAKLTGKGLGIAISDIDNDSDMDIYVSNNNLMNFLYINDSTGIFRENALFAGVGYNEHGQAESGTGVDFGDYDRDSFLDLFVTNISGESNRLYKNDGNGIFSDVTSTVGLGKDSFKLSGFSTKLVDLDLDGWLDIFIVNGHVQDNINLINKAYTHAQKKQVFINNGQGSFIDKTDEIGGDLLTPSVGRSAAFGDIDNDGDVDVIISNSNGQANLLINEGKPENNWIGIQLNGRIYNIDSIGAKVQVKTQSGIQWAMINPSGSYLSSNDKRLQFGIGKDIKIDEIIIDWPGGGIDRIEDIKPNHYYLIQPGGAISTIW
tara:strand:- start:7473 stop:9146 length:1674 start_codon:yes stop_codon:yes gene_type:complete